MLLRLRASLPLCSILLVAAAAVACGDDEMTPSAAPTPPAEAPVAPRLIEVTPDGVAPLLRAAPASATLVNVWSTWCKPCVDEFPELLGVARSYEARGLRTLFISADAPDQHDEALAFLVAQGASMPGYVKSGSDDAFIEALNPEWSGTLPATTLFDAQLRIVHHWEEPLNRAKLAAPIDALLRSQTTREVP